MEENVLERMQNIVDNLQMADLNDVTELLNYYNGDPVIINGTAYHPFNDPIVAAKLNARYYDLTGQDHPRFVEQAPAVIDGLLEEKDNLIQAKAYSPLYFESLEQIKNRIIQSQSMESGKTK